MTAADVLCRPIGIVRSRFTEVTGTTRAPARPNRLGLSIVRLLRVEGATLHFAGNDMVDSTPVLDIKPYVPRFDVRETGRIGWFAERLDALPTLRADGRMG